jgi:ketosteroid isomerase-like protein
VSESDRVRLLRELYEILDFKALADGRLDDRLAPYARPDFVLSPPPQYPDVGEYRGIEGVKAFFRMMTGVWDEWSFEPEDFRERGDVVVVLVHLHARGKESGVELDIDPTHLWRFEGAQPTGMRVFLDRAEALAAAGLESPP